MDLKANVNWTEADLGRVQWCYSGRNVECYCHVNKELNLWKWESGIFKSKLYQRLSYRGTEHNTSWFSKCVAQRDIMRNMDAVCTIIYCSFKLPRANKALQIQSDSHCPHNKMEEQYVL